jgi:hypothetical protein
MESVRMKVNTGGIFILAIFLMMSVLAGCGGDSGGGGGGLVPDVFGQWSFTIYYEDYDETYSAVIEQEGEDIEVNIDDGYYDVLYGTVSSSGQLHCVSPCINDGACFKMEVNGKFDSDSFSGTFKETVDGEPDESGTCSGTRTGGGPSEYPDLDGKWYLEWELDEDYGEEGAEGNIYIDQTGSYFEVDDGQTEGEGEVGKDRSVEFTFECVSVFMAGALPVELAKSISEKSGVKSSDWGDDDCYTLRFRGTVASGDKSMSGATDFYYNGSLYKNVGDWQASKR